MSVQTPNPYSGTATNSFNAIVEPKEDIADGFHMMQPETETPSGSPLPKLRLQEEEATSIDYRARCLQLELQLKEKAAEKVTPRTQLSMTLQEHKLEMKRMQEAHEETIKKLNAEHHVAVKGILDQQKELLAFKKAKHKEKLEQQEMKHQASLKAKEVEFDELDKEADKLDLEVQKSLKTIGLQKHQISHLKSNCANFNKIIDCLQDYITKLEETNKALVEKSETLSLAFKKLKNQGFLLQFLKTRYYLQDDKLIGRTLSEEIETPVAPSLKGYEDSILENYCDLKALKIKIKSLKVAESYADVDSVNDPKLIVVHT